MKEKQTLRLKKSRLTRAILATTLVSFSIGCSDGHHPSSPPPVNDSLRDQIIALGFRPNMIVDQGDHFLVDGDIFFSKQSLVKNNSSRHPSISRSINAPSAVSKQWTTTYVASAQNTINFDLSALNSYPDWKVATQQAISDWNSIGVSSGTGWVRLSLAEGTPSQVNVKMFSYPSSSVAAIASFPKSTGAPGDTIRINLNFAGSLSSSAKRFVMVHEIGHTLGFRHSDWNSTALVPLPPEAELPEGANLVPGTPALDYLSVMNRGTAGFPWLGFSTYDIAAVQWLFPTLVGVSINAPTSTSSGPLTVTATPAVPGNYYYKWRVRWCNYGTAPGDCDQGSYYPTVEGMNVNSVTYTYLARTKYMIYQVAISRTATGPTIGTSSKSVKGPWTPIDPGPCRPPNPC